MFFPAGTFRLSKPLYANASNVAIRGAGRDSTKLVFTKSLAEVYGAQWGVDKCTGEARCIADAMQGKGRLVRGASKLSG